MTGRKNTEHNLDWFRHFVYTPHKQIDLKIVPTKQMQSTRP